MRQRNNRALILGISGQDGAYLADLLLRKGLEVHGTTRDREISSFSNLRALGIIDKITLHSTQVTDFRSVATTLKKVDPFYIYNLSAQSSVGLSFDQPVETINSIMHGTINLMEAMRFLSLKSRLYNAGSSDCFGDTQLKPADETTEFHPRSPYGVGKSAAYWAVANYREAYELYACTGILFNHESPMRPTRFVTQKIVRGSMDIAEGKASSLELGALDIYRDWGWAPDHVDAMQRMLDLPEPSDLVIATGETYSLKDFVAGCFAYSNLDWQNYVVSRDSLRRSTDIAYSSANPAKAERLLGWKATVKMPGLLVLLLEAEQARRRAASA